MDWRIRRSDLRRPNSRAIALWGEVLKGDARLSGRAAVRHLHISSNALKNCLRSRAELGPLCLRGRANLARNTLAQQVARRGPYTCRRGLMIPRFMTGRNSTSFQALCRELPANSGRR